MTARLVLAALLLGGGFASGWWTHGSLDARREVATRQAQEAATRVTFGREIERLSAEAAMQTDLMGVLDDTDDLDRGRVVFGADRVRRLYPAR